MLAAALRRCTAAAAARSFLHPVSASSSAAGKARARHSPRPRVLAVTWAPAATRGCDSFFNLTGMNTLVGYDLVPEPKIIDAALRACRRLNDFASAVRILEVVKDKAGPHKDIYPYVIQELRPTLNELGISTPEELGLDKV
ncbi:cytochrome c oxidase subunit 5A, mitochondrial isoform X1 [Cricetulus griseus]|uniref:cytochrome c oxidase subunit 5A, mitochondrial isoform X1 n=1 Tax=Cricetulus griseus TaxID=10029 RepID=UPI0007DA5CAE|nr:cytochrome c oxidase subunit 5A, mitochondrial isoform X1 [Cricetulus griseus]